MTVADSAFPVPDALVALAERMLRDSVDADVRIAGAERLTDPERRNVVLRCAVEVEASPPTVIVKQAALGRYDPSDPAAHRPAPAVEWHTSMDDASRDRILSEQLLARLDAIQELVRPIPEMNERLGRVEERLDRVEQRLDVHEGILREHSADKDGKGRVRFDKAAYRQLPGDAHHCRHHALAVTGERGTTCASNRQLDVVTWTKPCSLMVRSAQPTNCTSFWSSVSGESEPLESA